MIIHDHPSMSMNVRDRPRSYIIVHERP